MESKIKVNIIGAAATVFDRKSCEVDARPGMKLRDLLVMLSNSAGPGYKERVYDPDTGKMSEFIAVFVNAREARSLHGPDTALKGGDVITILPAMAGGRDCHHAPNSRRLCFRQTARRC